MIGSALYSVAMKALHALLGFATIHALVGQWGTERYGLWVTFTSVAAYITMFDLGFGYGIRNRIAEAWSSQALARAEAALRMGVAFYAAASAIGLVVAAVVMQTVAPFDEHLLAAAMLWTGAIVAFFLSIHAIALQAIGRYELLATLTLIAPALWFAVVRLADGRFELSIERAALAYAATLVAQAAILAAASRRSLPVRLLGPAPIDWGAARTLLATGLKFFVLQLAALTLMSSGNFLVFKVLGGADAAHYDAANKVFSIVTLGYSVLIGIAWTEISKAKARDDVRRLRRVYGLLHAAALAMLAVAAAFALGADWLVVRLTGIPVSASQAAAFAALVGVQTLAYASAVVLNAFERLRPQIVTALLSIPLFLLIALGLLRGGYGIASIPLATALALLPSLLVCAAVAWGLVMRPAPMPATA